MCAGTGKRVRPVPSLGPIFGGWLSPAVQGGGLVFLSGIVGVHPDTGKVATTDVELQIRHIFMSVERILVGYGTTLEKLVKMNVYLINLGAHLPVFRSVCRQVLPGQPPAVTAVGVNDLAEGALVAADALGAVPCQQAGWR